jgi:hypothetical protein
MDTTLPSLLIISSKPSMLEQRMEHGVKNEINAVATIVAKVLPVFFPELVFYEEGCYKLVHDTIPIIVSPDGSCRNANDKPLLANVTTCTVVESEE